MIVAAVAIAVVKIVVVFATSFVAVVMVAISAVMEEIYQYMLVMRNCRINVLKKPQSPKF